MLPDTSSMKNTTACIAGCLRRASWRNRRSSSVNVGVAFGIAATLDELLEGAAPIEPRARAAPVPAFAHPVRLVRGADARLEIRQLHLLPEPVDDVVDLELEQELHFAFVLPARALLARAALAVRALQYIAGLGFALARAFLVLRAAQAEVIVLEHAHGHAHGLARRR